MYAEGGDTVSAILTQVHLSLRHVTNHLNQPSPLHNTSVTTLHSLTVDPDPLCDTIVCMLICEYDVDVCLCMYDAMVVGRRESLGSVKLCCFGTKHWFKHAERSIDG